MLVVAVINVTSFFMAVRALVVQIDPSSASVHQSGAPRAPPCRRMKVRRDPFTRRVRSWIGGCNRWGVMAQTKWGSRVRRIRVTTAFVLLGLVATACTSTDPTTEQNVGSTAPPASADLVEPPATEQNGGSTAPPVSADLLEPIVASEWEATTFRFDQLDLSSPAHAVTEMIQAHEDQDFLRAALLFDLDAQRQLAGAAFGLRAEAWQRQHVRMAFSPFNEAEHVGSGLMMLVRGFDLADGADLLVADLAGAQIRAIWTPQTVERFERETPSVDVELELPDGSLVIVRTTEQSPGRWRVGQLVLDGVEPDLALGPILRAGCPGTGVRTHPDVECPTDTAGEPSQEVQAEIDRLRAEAGDDINRQITSAQQITALLDADRISDARICGAMQGTSPIDLRTADRGRLQSRAEALLASTCPGELDALLTAPPDLRDARERFDDRSIYGSLALGSPEEAVRSFAMAYAEGAYLPAYLALSPGAQGQVEGGVRNVELRRFLTDAGLELVGLDTEHAFPDMGFVEYMERAAGVEGGHRLELSGPLQIGAMEEIEWTNSYGPVAPASRIDVTVGDTDFTFVLVQSFSGRWRVDLIAEGSLAELVAGPTPFLPGS